MIYSSNNSTGSLTYTPISNANGDAIITVTITDNGGTANSGVNAQSTTFSITVTAVNDEPSYINGEDVAILEDSGISITPDWATSISTGPPNESNQIQSLIHI